MISFKESAVQLLVTGDPQELDQLDEDFKERPKGYFFAPSYERFRLTGGKEGWDGYWRAFKRMARNQALTMRGRRDEILAACKVHGIETDLSGLLPQPFGEIVLGDIPEDLIQAPFPLDEYQRRAIYLWLSRSVGINQATVGAGKTAMFAGAAAYIKARYPEAAFLYMTPAERLVRQVTPEMRRFLPGWEIGQYGGGHDDFEAKDMVVATIAMLTRHLRDLSAINWWRRFVCVLFDEAHHAVSDSSQKILLRMPAFFRFGASDSVKLNDPQKQAIMKGLLGDILATVDAQPHIKSGRLAKPHIYIESMADQYGHFDGVSFRPPSGSAAWVLANGTWHQGIYRGPVYKTDDDGNVIMRKRTVMEEVMGRLEKRVIEEPVTETGYHRIEIDGDEYQTESRWCLLSRVYDLAIVRYEERNRRIVRWVRHFSSLGHPTLVVCTRTLHIYILEALIAQEVDPKRVRICFGSSTPKERDRAFDWLRKTKGAVLITPLVKEGVSINEIKAGVVADYVGDIETANQIIGRFIRRKNIDNWSEIVWFAEDQHQTLRRNSRRIIQAFGSVYKYPVHDPAPSFKELLGEV